MQTIVQTATGFVNNNSVQTAVMGKERNYLYAYPYPQKDSCFKAFRRKDPIIKGFWAMFMLRDGDEEELPLRLGLRI